MWSAKIRIKRRKSKEEDNSNYKLQITNYKLQITNDKLQMTNERLSAERPGNKDFRL